MQGWLRSRLTAVIVLASFPGRLFSERMERRKRGLVLIVFGRGWKYVAVLIVKLYRKTYRKYWKMTRKINNRTTLLVYGQEFYLVWWIAALIDQENVWALLDLNHFLRRNSDVANQIIESRSGNKFEAAKNDIWTKEPCLASNSGWSSTRYTNIHSQTTF